MKCKELKFITKLYKDIRRKNVYNSYCKLFKSTYQHKHRY